MQHSQSLDPQIKAVLDQLPETGWTLSPQTEALLNRLVLQSGWNTFSSRQKQALVLAALMGGLESMQSEREELNYQSLMRLIDKKQNRYRKTLWKKGYNNEKRDLRELALRLLALQNAPLWAENEPGKRVFALLLTDQALLKEFTPELIKAFVQASHEDQAEEISQLFDELPQLDLHKDEDINKPTVIMLSGLPASGKDTLIARQYPDMDVVSLDDIRKETGISPVGDQSEVVRIAKERAADLLKEGKPFVWNATSLNKRLRKQQRDLFRDLGARTKIVYLETDFNQLLERNKKREATVPQDAIERMLNIIDPPHYWEGDEVEWIYT